MVPEIVIESCENIKRDETDWEHRQVGSLVYKSCIVINILKSEHNYIAINKRLKSHFNFLVSLSPPEQVYII